MTYFAFVAEEVRAGLASLGLSSLDELVGNGSVLRQRAAPLAKTENLDLGFLTRGAVAGATSSGRRGAEPHGNGPQLDDELLADPEVQVASAPLHWAGWQPATASDGSQ